MTYTSPFFTGVAIDRVYIGLSSQAGNELAMLVKMNPPHVLSAYLDDLDALVLDKFFFGPTEDDLKLLDPLTQRVDKALSGASKPIKK
jgi:hypothetical protein